MGKGNTVKLIVFPTLPGIGLDKKSFVSHVRLVSFFLCLSRMFDWYLMSKMRVECLEFSANFFGSLCVSSLPYNQTRTRKLYLENLRPFAFLYVFLRASQCLFLLVSTGNSCIYSSRYWYSGCCWVIGKADWPEAFLVMGSNDPSTQAPKASEQVLEQWYHTWTFWNDISFV